MSDYIISVKHGDLQGICRMCIMFDKLYLNRSLESENEQTKTAHTSKTRNCYEESLQVAIQKENTLSVMLHC